MRTTGTAPIISAAGPAASTINGTRSDRGEATASGWRRRAERNAGYLRCRILDRMRRFLRPILRRPFPVFLLPTQDSVRFFGGSRYCGKTDQPARGPSVLIGRVPGAACLPPGHGGGQAGTGTQPLISIFGDQWAPSENPSRHTSGWRTVGQRGNALSRVHGTPSHAMRPRNQVLRQCAVYQNRPVQSNRWSCGWPAFPSPLGRADRMQGSRTVELNRPPGSSRRPPKWPGG